MNHYEPFSTGRYQKIRLRQETGALQHSPSLNDSDQHNNNGNNQQGMDEPAHRIATYQAQQPQNYQYNSNRPQHVLLLSEKKIRPPVSAKNKVPFLQSGYTSFRSSNIHRSFRMKALRKARSRRLPRQVHALLRKPLHSYDDQDY
jgi:hypothetical protein